MAKTLLKRDVQYLAKRLGSGWIVGSRADDDRNDWMLHDTSTGTWYLASVAMKFYFMGHRNGVLEANNLRGGR